MRVRLAVVLPFILGIFFGTMITSFLMLAVQSIDEEPSLIGQESEDEGFIEPEEPESFDDMLDEEQKNKKAPTLSPSQLASFNVLTSKVAFKDRSSAIHRTWGSEKAILKSMEYYIYPRAGKEEISFANSRKMKVTSLEMEGDVEGVENQGTFKLWKNICDKKQKGYLWFVKLHDNVYLRRTSLMAMLSSLNSSASMFVGKAVFPSGKRREDLGLREGESYCHESCYILSWKAVNLLCPKLQTCQENARSTNEDVEIARCIKRHLQVNCTAATEVSTSVQSMGCGTLK
jgi:hypothetical protein